MLSVQEVSGSNPRSVKFDSEQLSPHHTRIIMPKHETNDGAHLRCLAHGQHRSEGTPLWWRVVDNTVSDLTDPGFEPQASGNDSNVSTTELTGRLPFYIHI